MKTKHLIKIFTLSFFLAALSCEEDIIIDNLEEVQLESKWLDAKRKTSSISKISSKDIPEVVSYLQSMTSKGYDPNTSKTHQPIIDFEHGVSLTDSLGRTNYTFSMFVPEKKYKGPRLYSLIVGVDAEGRMSNPMVLRLTPKKGQEKKWIEDDFDFSKFKGKVSLHKYTDFFNENPFSRTTDYCPPEYDQYGDPIECVADEVDGGGTGGSGGSYAPAGGATGGCTYSMYWNYCGGSNDNISHPGGPPPICGGDGSGAGWVLETSCPNYTDITIFHKSSGAKSDCPNCETGPSGDVVMYSYDRSVAKLEYYLKEHFDHYLTPSELTWLNINPDIAYNINQPLKTDGFSTSNMAIAYAKLQLNMYGSDITNQHSAFLQEVIRLNSSGTSTAQEFVNTVLKDDWATAMKMLVSGNRIECCQYDPTCCDNEIFHPITQLTARIIIDAKDAVFNYVMFMLETETSWTRRGRAVRGFMEDLGVEVPTDIDDRTLGTLFKVRKRNTEIVIEPVGDYADTLIDVGISMLDILSVVSPSKGAGAYLFVKSGGNMTAKAISNYLKLISVNAAKIDGLITKLVPKAKYSLDGTGAFRYLKGHHPLAKIAFNKNKARNYSELDAFSVSKSKLESFGGPDVHNIITGKQTSLYKEFGRTGERLTIEKMADIEINAMVQAGIPEDIATGWVIKALQDLKLQNVKTIPHIPWVGKN